MKLNVTLVLTIKTLLCSIHIPKFLFYLPVFVCLVLSFHFHHQILYCYLIKQKNSTILFKNRLPTETGKPGKNGKAFCQGILNGLEKSWKITQNTGKLGQFQTNIICYFLVIFKWTVYYFLKWIKFSVQFFFYNTGKVREFCQSGKVGTMKKLCK